MSLFFIYIFHIGSFSDLRRGLSVRDYDLILLTMIGMNARLIVINFIYHNCWTFFAVIVVTNILSKFYLSNWTICRGNNSQSTRTQRLLFMILFLKSKLSFSCLKVLLIICDKFRDPFLRI
jgi:hypothetical protein